MSDELAHRTSLCATIPEMASTLQELVGQRLVAYVTGSRSNRTVARWAGGDNAPSLKGEVKLRALYRVVLTLQGTESPETIRAWMTSANPHLGDEVPAEILRGGNPVRVYHAAQAFIA